ncbi:hypothetical protein LAZ40_11850 [Cereibacter sphaeroides]|uniref:hypothetical protein n=1 Tax=Cereibacter sphaeroides TaxID=1063 RepID=UPI001F24FE70|nr:hypothetical protein [Cereibacter sphaeroides]MCE6959713.1 hypothetical protein [Cereibacter sphaeroides]MCE6974426.1 hypothetical protein [Cereibacter sphaeroides]
MSDKNLEPEAAGPLEVETKPGLAPGFVVDLASADDPDADWILSVDEDRMLGLAGEEPGRSADEALPPASAGGSRLGRLMRRLRPGRAKAAGEPAAEDAVDGSASDEPDTVPAHPEVPEAPAAEIERRRPSVRFMDRIRRRRPAPDVTMVDEADTFPDPEPDQVLDAAADVPAPASVPAPRGLARISGKISLRKGSKTASPAIGTSEAVDPMDLPPDAAPKKSSFRQLSRGDRGMPPIQVLIGWLGDTSLKDVLEHARGFAADHLETLETAWFLALPFRGGYIFEVHEGGSGMGYLPDVVEELTRDPEQVVWIPSGTALNRVLTVRITEERVYSSILTESESAMVRASGQEPLERAGRMTPLVPKGVKVLALGASLAAIGTVTLLVAAVHSGLVGQQPLPSRPFNGKVLPHSQIVQLAGNIHNDRWVSRIVFEDGQWRADFEDVKKLSLPVDDAQAQEKIDQVLDEEKAIRRQVEETIRKETGQ